MLGLIDLLVKLGSTTSVIVLQFVNLHLFTTSHLSQTWLDPGVGRPADRNDISMAFRNLLVHGSGLDDKTGL